MHRLCDRYLVRLTIVGGYIWIDVYVSKLDALMDEMAHIGGGGGLIDGLA